MFPRFNRALQAKLILRQYEIRLKTQAKKIRLVNRVADQIKRLEVFFGAHEE